MPTPVSYYAIIGSIFSAILFAVGLFALLHRKPSRLSAMARYGHRERDEEERNTRRQRWRWYLEFFKFFKLRNVLIPFSIDKVRTIVGDRFFNYTDWYVFGFRVVRLHANKHRQ